ncbi:MULTISPECIES: hypothetical protein [unclassified Moorena]|nr:MULTISPECIES: hypothetical protein [unclassified Moorena]
MKPSTKTTFNQNNFQPVNLGQRPRYANNLLTLAKGHATRTTC